MNKINEYLAKLIIIDNKLAELDKERKTSQGSNFIELKRRQLLSQRKKASKRYYLEFAKNNIHALRCVDVRELGTEILAINNRLYCSPTVEKLCDLYSKECNSKESAIKKLQKYGFCVARTLTDDDGHEATIIRATPLGQLRLVTDESTAFKYGIHSQLMCFNKVDTSNELGR